MSINHPDHLVHTTLPRGSLDVSLHTIVDESLKDLKIVHQRLEVNIVALFSELRLLERIYYKGKNQHRTALFWRKVIEVRRICTRISCLGAIEVVEQLRYTFYDTQDPITPKILKRPWNQVPSVATCTFFMGWLSTVSQLVNKARLCFRLAHQSFTKQIQAASFLPLVLALISILSRLDFVVAELHGVFDTQWKALQRISRILSDPDTKINRGLTSQSNPFQDLKKNNLPRKWENKTGLPDNDLEDFGNKIRRRSDLPHSGPITEITDEVGIVQVEMFSDSVLCGKCNALHSTSEDPTHKSCQTPAHVEVTEGTKPYTVYSPVSQNASVSRKSKKRKAKTIPVNTEDEIDNIFRI